MYPMLLKPVIKNYIWGGERLIRDFGFDAAPPAAEAWLLSCRNDADNEILNGEYAGRKLSEVAGYDKGSFPLLVKLIDAADDLSVQVHPGAECAALYEGDSAKTEMWYVIDCDEGASIIFGFDENALKKKRKNEDRPLCDELAAAVRDGCVTDILRKVPVRPGDVFLVSPGTVHAIGRGILIAEIQQNSDTTYRVYDYDRVGADGKPRELHVDKALNAVKLAEKATTLSDVAVKHIRGWERILDAGIFSVRIITLDTSLELDSEDGFESLIILSGAADLYWEGGTAHLSKGASVFIPSGSRYRLSGRAEAMICRPARNGQN